MRRLVVSIVALAVVLSAQAAFAVPNSGQSEKRLVVDFEDPELWESLSEDVTSYCGFEVEVEVYGWVQILLFPEQKGARQHLELNVFHSRIQFINPQTGEHLELLDVGPDHYYIQDGTAFLALTGRSLTGSGVIGHVVINLDTGEDVMVAGNDHGFFLDDVCDQLRP